MPLTDAEIAMLTTSSEYAKRIAIGAQKTCGHEEECGCEKEECGCCPPGTIAVLNENDEMSACLSPTDAAVYNESIKPCKPGYIKVYAASGGKFVGCVTPEDATALKTAGIIA